MVIVAVALPRALATVISTGVLPALTSDPVIRPLLGSSVSPFGRFWAVNVSGSSPEAGIMNMKGLPGVAPVMRG